TYRTRVSDSTVPELVDSGASGGCVLSRLRGLRFGSSCCKFHSKLFKLFLRHRRCFNIDRLYTVELSNGLLHIRLQSLRHRAMLHGEGDLYLYYAVLIDANVPDHVQVYNADPYLGIQHSP